MNAPWQNQVNPLDVNGDSLLSPIGDVLPGINELNNRLICDEVGRLAVLKDRSDAPYLDVDGDHYLSPAGDILPIINALNSQTAGEGEKGADHDFATLGTDVDMLASVNKQTYSAVGMGQTSMDQPPRSRLIPNQRDRDDRPRADDVRSVDSRTYDGPAHSGSVAPGTGDELDTLEPLVVDLAEDLAAVWYDRPGEVV